jgi:hypothetical protein
MHLLFVFIISCFVIWNVNAQSQIGSYFPIRDVSINDIFVKDIFPENYYMSSDYYEEPPILGYEYNITINFKVDDYRFYDDPKFQIFVVYPDDQIQKIVVDSTMIWIECDNCLSVSFNVSVDHGGWLTCYCFPIKDQIDPSAISQIKKSTVYRSIYLR